MTMKTEILSALEQNEDPMTSEEIILQVHRQSGINWKRSSVRRALGQLVARGQIVNLDRDPVTGFYRQTPCRYLLADRVTLTHTAEAGLS